jgi:hypothetical protein
MNCLLELRLLCKKFENKGYSIDDFLQTLAYFPSPESWGNLIADAEYAIERVRFLTPKNRQYDEVVIIIRNLISAIEQFNKP